MTLANLDGQHGLDIIATDPSGNQVWVIMNEGNGTFGAPTAYSTGTYPVAVAVADLGNGHDDIVTANENDNTVSVLLGNGDGTFQAQTDYPVDTKPEAVAISSFTAARGSLNLFTANEGGNSVSILRGNGTGDFQPAVDLPIIVTVGGVVSRKSAPVDVALGDFNGDGNLDLVTANSGTASVTVALGNGDGSFGVQQNIIDSMRHGESGHPDGRLCSRSSGDGDCDITFTEPQRGSIGVLSGNGDGTFASQVNYLASGDPVGMAIANLNGDKTSLGLDRLDVVTVDPTDPRVAILLGQKWSIPTSLGMTSQTISWGQSITVTPAASTGYASRDSA